MGSNYRTNTISVKALVEHAEYVPVLDDGRQARFEHREIDHCCERFALVNGGLNAKGTQRRGTLRHREARLSQAHGIVRVVSEQLAADETMFLHPSDVDAECDEVRKSLVGGKISASR